MGNSLQEYRLRIGLFRGSSSKTNSRSSQYSGPKYKNDLLYKTLQLCFSLMLLFSVANIDKCCSNPEQIHPTQLNLQATNLSRTPYGTDFNFLARYTNGNGRKRNGIKLAHINLGGGYLCNKRNEIEYIIRDYKPHVLGISETRFEHDHNLDDVKIENYDVFFCKTLQNPILKTSRCAVYVHKDVVVKERSDLMNDTFSSVWLELGLPKQKKILVANFYREWQYLHQGTDTASLSIPAQLSRWVSFLEQWEAAITEEKEIHAVGDANLDFLKWKDTRHPDQDTGRLRQLITELFNRIITHGFAQLVSEPTRVQRGQEPSGLDHYYSNKPHKVSSINTFFHGGSDHKLILAIRQSKVKITNQRIVFKRSYKNFDPKVFLSAVSQISWWEVYSSENIESAVELFTNKLNSILNKMAPMKKFQVRTKYAPWMSSSTKEKVKIRDAAQKKASETGKTEDWMEYKTIRNTLNNILRKEKELWQKKKLKECSGDSRTTWKNLKSWLGWRSVCPPTKLVENGEMFSNPSKLANIMSQFFIKKVKNLRSNIPQTPEDPLELTCRLIARNTSSFTSRAVHPDETLKPSQCSGNVPK